MFLRFPAKLGGLHTMAFLALALTTSLPVSTARAEKPADQPVVEESAPKSERPRAQRLRERPDAPKQDDAVRPLPPLKGGFGDWGEGRRGDGPRGEGPHGMRRPPIEQLRTALEIGDTEAALYLLDEWEQTLPPAGEPPHGAFEGPEPSMPDERMMPDERPGVDSYSPELRQNMGLLARQRSETQRFLARYQQESKRLNSLEEKLKSNTLNSEGVSAEQVAQRRAELEAKRAEFLRKFRERHPKTLATGVETAELLESLPEDQHPRAAEMATRLRSHINAFPELPKDDNVLWERILDHSKSVREQALSVQERPRTELTTPREEQLRREIDLLQQRLDALKTDLDVLKPAPQP
ncbi:MAG: hypothetical protein SFY68_15640 [Candidatus Sumerlaeia bacterium]|nr:hypothetical protein [Candidatus Sumerlaeia bacterium]